MVAKRFFVMAMRNKLLYLIFSFLFFSHFCFGEIRGNIRAENAKSKASAESEQKSVVHSRARKTFKDSLNLKDYPKSLERSAIFRVGEKINIHYATLKNASKNSISRKRATPISKESSGKRTLKNTRTLSNGEIPGWLAKLNKKEKKTEPDAKNTQIKGVKFISFIINQHNSEIQDCYHDYLKKYPDVRGRMVVRITVNGNGLVGKVTIKESNIQDDIFKNRIIKIIKKWDDLGRGNHESKVYLQEYVFGE